LSLKGKDTIGKNNWWAKVELKGDLPNLVNIKFEVLSLYSRQRRLNNLEYNI